MKSHLMPGRMILTDRQILTSVGRDVEEKELLPPLGGDKHWAAATSRM